ncbi:hypothetical protein LV84_01612 [Algoriphagus ratkowskyi]|uniref:DUF4440 domain-containing protein n=1 Tax=Algoriphagus ratkowskyi TaxID=57028 RepID=A0A2W7RDA6_9BACT|nr:hypothetical protein [Algoriphagus ratkowskyi]PZX58404.1 hypothetical protein LV84_01612 [Algoriphagus ratkowskyi]TXD77728.1 hypothetical protein ESW18_10160 [Algoriphagus ratkowskyi]
MKQCIRNLILGFTLLLGIATQQSNAQLSEEQYKVLSSMYDGTSVELFEYTIEAKLWSKFLNSKDLDFYKIATCYFFDDDFMIASQEVEAKLWGARSKRLEKKKLPDAIELIESYELASVRITEPVIVGKYAFVFQEAEDNQFLFILIKEDNIWSWQCYLQLYQEPFVDPSIR